MPAEEEPINMEGRETPQQFCLRWNNYQSNLTSCFDQLLQTELFVDVTLACEGQKLKAHKLVLSACSPYFQELLIDNPCQHPIIIMNNDIKYCDLKAVVYYMYRGEINVSEDQIPALLKVAETLKIRGLTDVSPSQSMLHEEGRTPKRTMTRDKSPQPERTRRRLSENREAAGSQETRRASPGSPPAAPADLSGSRGASPGDAPPPPPMPPLPTDDADIRPGIAEMIREEERVSIHVAHAVSQSFPAGARRRGGARYSGAPRALRTTRATSHRPYDGLNFPYRIALRVIYFGGSTLFPLMLKL
ncbi:protein bric-a-brac 2-like [Manduca sexta]|uniref:protein bric-a-brac 2-like n=1 Tax=Manduca sexta TaxID=7130 RepID=UPI00188F72C2|nr:protein bric-a-brac 2-like [Manduca sexta]